MKRKNIWAIAVTAASAILYSACEDSSTSANADSNNGSSNNSPFSGTVGTFDELQVCTEKRNEMEVLVKDEDKTYICQNEKWVVKGTEDEPQKGSSDSKGDKAEPADEGDDAKSSSSVKAESSSSVQSGPNKVSGVCGDLWCGYTDAEGRVLTGYEDKYETSGYWYPFDDNDKPYNGNSKISLNFDVEPPEYSFYIPVNIEEHGGLFGSVTLGNAYEFPYAGLGFNIVSEEQQGADVTDWNGVCLVYSSTVPFYVELGVENENEVTEGNDYKASVAESASLQVVDIPWAKFKQDPGWGKIMSQADILKIVAAIRIKFRSSSGEFYITSIGRIGTCNKEVEAYGISVPTFSSSSTNSSSSVKSSSSSAGYKEFPMSHDGTASQKECSPATLSGVGKTVASSFNWDGSDTEGRVDTGSDETGAGYWYVFNETTIEGVKGDSKVYFPSDEEENAYGNFFGPLAETYGGIKGRVELGTEYDYPVAGIGFNIVSEEMEGADITNWGGICLVYSSTAPFTVELVAEDECSVTGFNNYKASVAKTKEKTWVQLPWTKFKQETGWGTTVSQDEFLKHVAAVRLRFSASSGDFFISAIGYQNGCMSGPGLPGFTY